MIADAPEPFPDRLKRLARERGTSVSRVSHEAWNPNVEGTSPSTLQKALSKARPLPRQLIEAVAAVLSVEPDYFPEYRLAQFRRLFDEREVGLEEALVNLSELQTAVSGRGAPPPPGELGRLLQDDDSSP